MPFFKKKLYPILIMCFIIFLFAYVRIMSSLNVENWFAKADRIIISLCGGGDGYAVAASSTLVTADAYPNPNYVYYDNNLSTSPATVVSTSTFTEGDVNLYLKSIRISNSTGDDAYITLTSSETDAASTEIASINVPKANSVNQPTTYNLDWIRVIISSDTKLKIEADTTTAVGDIRCSLKYEKY